MIVDIVGGRASLTLSEEDALNMIKDLSMSLLQLQKYKMDGVTALNTGIPVIVDSKTYPGVFNVYIEKAK